MPLHVQVLVEHLSFLPVSRLCNAFTQDRVLVNHSPVGPAYQLALGQILEYVFHRHEPEVKCKWGVWFMWPLNRYSKHVYEGIYTLPSTHTRNVVKHLLRSPLS